MAATPFIFVSHKSGSVSHKYSGVLAQKNGGKCPHDWCLKVAGEVFLPEKPLVVEVAAHAAHTAATATGGCCVFLLRKINHDALGG